MKRTLALTLLASLAVCAPAAAASKPPKKLIRWTYAVTVKGDATYHYEASQPTIGGALTTTDDLTFRFKAKMPKFQFLAGKVLNTGIGRVKLSAVEAKRHESMPDLEGGVATGDCAGTTATSGTATLLDGRLAPLDPKDEPIDPKKHMISLELLPFSSFTAPFTCVGRLNGPGAISFVDETGHGQPFLIPFDLPLEAVGHGKVIQLFDEKAWPCPAPSREFMTKCDFHMKGEITLRRTGKKVFGSKLR